MCGKCEHLMLPSSFLLQLLPNFPRSEKRKQTESDTESSSESEECRKVVRNLEIKINKYLNQVSSFI